MGPGERPPGVLPLPPFQFRTRKRIPGKRNYTISQSVTRFLPARIAGTTLSGQGFTSMRQNPRRSLHPLPVAAGVGLPLGGMKGSHKQTELA